MASGVLPFSDIVEVALPTGQLQDFAGVARLANRLALYVSFVKSVSKEEWSNFFCVFAGLAIRLAFWMSFLNVSFWIGLRIAPFPYFQEYKKPLIDECTII